MWKHNDRKFGRDPTSNIPMKLRFCTIFWGTSLPVGDMVIKSVCCLWYVCPFWLTLLTQMNMNNTKDTIKIYILIPYMYIK